MTQSQMLTDQGLEFIHCEESFFSRHEDHIFEEGWMSIDDAKRKVMANSRVCLGFSVQHGGTPDHSYCYIVKLGTAKYNSHDCPFDSYVFKKKLPSAKEMKLYEDDFSERKWLRPGRGEGLADGFQELRLFSGIDPNDLHQGSLGDCWLISAMAAYAEFPDAVMDLFVHKTLALDGHYCVSLYSYKERRFVQIDIDDRLPTNKRGEPMNVHMTESGEIWPCLLEKAFAKYSGGYHNIDGGFSDFAFGAFTGCTDLATYMRKDDEGEWEALAPKYTTNSVQDAGGMAITGTESDDSMLHLLAEYDTKNYLMSCGSHAGSDTEMNKSGIVQGHAYSLITVKLDIMGTGFNLLCLRNPWGKQEWSGDWSDNSALWDEHPEVAQECGFTKDEDGLFWMDWEDFCHNYSNIYVCKQSMTATHRGKRTLAQNTEDIISGAIHDRLPRISPGIGMNRDINTSVLSGCKLC
eukprot:TRINITY_DN2974_c0_g1_i7.p1 TRINITY_DN2974_c0_g1~~TRINITY_DN2974_c0_g1_i7.p1  ORF type:complete len:463 (+),score=81.10 TRINITY_DN2974_c0_g1_i7:74-1462(+)